MDGRRKTVVLTFDDACKSHLDIVAPILSKYGFGATFFICRFNDDWREKNEPHLLTAAEVRALHDMGFEIGNHTWNHPNMQALSDDECGAEIDQLNEFFAAAGVARPLSFAYPGGPYAANAAPVIAGRGFLGARTTEKRAWVPASDEPMRIPAIPIQGEDRSLFYGALELAGEDNAVVLVFHGVPDLVHPWVDTSPEIFAEYMDHLHRNDFAVLAMRDLYR